MSQMRRLYPGSGRTLLDGGLNTKFERSIISDNESPDCLNVIFKNGSAETRQGTTKLNTAAVGTFVFDGLYTRKADTGAETMVAFAGGTMWQLTGTSFITIGSAQSVFTAGNRVSTAQYENHMFIGNGGVVPYKYNGTDFTRHGVYSPVATSTIASNGAGNLAGVYRYKVTNVNSQSVESDVGPVSDTFTATATGSILRVSAIPAAPQSYGVSARRLYRTVAGGSTFKRVTEIADNSTTTYDDNIADGSLGVDAPTDKGVPPNYSLCVYHQNRLFVNDPANPNYVWYSDLGEPYTFGATNFIKIGDATSDLVKAFGVFDNGIMVYCANSAHIVYMPSTDESGWSVLKISSPYGSKSPFCVLDYNGRQLFGAMQNDKFVGFGAVLGNNLEHSSTNLTISTAVSDLKSERIETDLFTAVEAYIPNMSGIVFKNRAYISLTYSSGSTNNRIYVMDFSSENIRKNQKEVWVPWTGLNAAQFTIYAGNLYYASSDTTGFVYRLEAGVYSDNGSAINSYIWTKEFSGTEHEYNYFKDFRYANVFLENSGDWFMNITYRVDSDIGDGNVTAVDLNPGSSVWGSMIWGVDNWGGGTQQKEYRLFLGASRGKRIQFKFSNQNVAGQSFKVHGLNFAYNLKGYR